jgi:hypothetical protein
LVVFILSPWQGEGEIGCFYSLPLARRGGNWLFLFSPLGKEERENYSGVQEIRRGGAVTQVIELSF